MYATEKAAEEDAIPGKMHAGHRIKKLQKAGDASPSNNNAGTAAAADGAPGSPENQKGTAAVAYADKTISDIKDGKSTPALGQEARKRMAKLV